MDTGPAKLAVLMAHFVLTPSRASSAGIAVVTPRPIILTGQKGATASSPMTAVLVDSMSLMDLGGEATNGWHRVCQPRGFLSVASTKLRWWMFCSKHPPQEMVTEAIWRKYSWQVLASVPWRLHGDSSGDGGI